jgi:mono/diheme cytochrome c family protein
MPEEHQADDSRHDGNSPHAAPDMDLVAMHEELLRERHRGVIGPRLTALFLLLAAITGGYFGGNLNETRRGRAPVTAKVPANIPAPAVDRSAEIHLLGKSVYSRTCAVCHQTTGLGMPGVFPPLVGSEWVLSEGVHTPPQIIRIVLHGVLGPISVKGETYSSVMAPLGTALGDEEVAAVLTYIRNEWGNVAPPILADQVAQVREENKGRTEPWTQEQLKATSLLQR